MLIDSHCHLDFPDFTQERAEIISRAQAAGVGLMVTISTRVRKFPQVLAIAEEYGNVFCSVGTHPHNAHEELDISAEDLVRLSQHPKVVAIGEAGLDYFYDKSPRDAQAQGFRTHIAAARQTQLPLVIHARDADADIARILSAEHAAGAFACVMHCFTSGRALAETALALGFYLSISGIATFRSAEALRAIFRDAPRDRLLVETDSPYLAPVPHRGKRNEPAFTADTVRAMAPHLGMEPEELAALTAANFDRLFAKAAA